MKATVVDLRDCFRVIRLVACVGAAARCNGSAAATHLHSWRLFFQAQRRLKSLRADLTDAPFVQHGSQMEALSIVGSVRDLTTLPFVAQELMMCKVRWRSWRLHDGCASENLFLMA